MECPFCHSVNFTENRSYPINQASLFDWKECDQCGAKVWTDIGRSKVLEIRKSAAFLQKENTELQAQIRALEARLQGVSIHALEMQTVVAYLLRERLGGQLKMSLETHRLVQKSREYEFGITAEQGGAVRSYETQSMRMIKLAGEMGNEPLIALPGQKRRRK